MKAPRDVFGETITAISDDYPNLVVLCADLAAATKAGVFAVQHPEKYLNVGICEQNMMSVAAGLASEGFIVCASTFAVFAAGRAFDQVRQSIAFDSYNVKIAATHPGLAVGADGAIHQCLEDIALMRSIPNMTVLCPSDEISTAEAVKTALQTPGPVYIRIGRAELPKLYTTPFRFEVGRSYVLREGRDITLAACGIMTYRALLLADKLAQKNIFCEVLDCSSIKPFDTKTLIQSAKKTGCVMTVEDHSRFGGLGSCVAEVLAEQYPVPLKIIGTNDCFGESGDRETLFDAYGFGFDDLTAQVEALIKKK
ncbi:transketolase family protein [Treponema sp. OMZ 840]|uniref:transketolase family protein n=1 Tax=Treponema sp. OMZ 840 TaxID=244313 RepID=UPI003D8E1293